MQQKISDSEWKIMEVLWEIGRATQSEIMDRLDMQWNKNTVYTFLSRLEGKKMVRTMEDTSPKVYEAVVQREAWVRKEQENFLNKVYHGSVGKMVTAFVEEGKLTADEVEELKRLLEGMEI